jgi:hypothetical protein
MNTARVSNHDSPASHVQALKNANYEIERNLQTPPELLLVIFIPVVRYEGLSRLPGSQSQAVHVPLHVLFP